MQKWNLEIFFFFFNLVYIGIKGLNNVWSLSKCIQNLSLKVWTHLYYFNFKILYLSFVWDFHWCDYLLNLITNLICGHNFMIKIQIIISKFGIILILAFEDLKFWF